MPYMVFRLNLYGQHQPQIASQLKPGTRNVCEANPEPLWPNRLNSSCNYRALPAGVSFSLHPTVC
jgi:hypothetical protein